MWTRRAVLSVLCAGSVGLCFLLACSMPNCPHGIWPYLGQSAVPLDTIIELRVGAALPLDLPPLEGAVGLEVVDGPRVPVEIEVHHEEGLVRLIPKAPLEEGTAYRAWGVDTVELDRLHWFDQLPGSRAVAEFTTASAPALLDAWIRDETVYVAFSEPVDLDSLHEEVLWWDGKHSDPSGVAEVVDYLDGARHLVELRIEQEGESRRPSLLGMGPGARAESGASFAEAPALWLTDLSARDPDELSGALRTYEGLPRCGGAP